ncbi:hypothetical protein E1091_02030 [Micromonospora fluostatini]|uniref:Uncharacterized protein n=1 Tax=Micromonospora fluostatini TaxID=1629071 RepID=A0ABY2DL72_9ACTN|nr:hypothetical protein E1091_02030 [Micromonospora fluostatini]
MGFSFARAAVAVALVAGVVLTPITAASAHPEADKINLYPPVQGSSTWDRFGLSAPASHHIVFGNWGYPNDWSVDIYRNPGATVVSPFGSRTTSGHPVTVTVVTVRPGCATGNLADGGYRIGLEARDNTTGQILARADVMHVTNKPGGIVVGATVGPWTKLGETGRFRYSSCYQVNGDSGAHLHLEVINQHRYSCYVRRAANTALTDETVIGVAGTHHGAQRQAC